MRTFILLTDKPWHDQLFLKLSGRWDEKWIRLRKINDETEDLLVSLEPRFVFVPHWSRIISERIWSRWNVVVFHMTDLPFGRGGSPLQNLIVRGYKETKLSALLVDGGIDTGPVFLKRDLSLEGSAREIFERSTGVISSMISAIIDQNLEPVQQKGEVTLFTRRRPEDGNCAQLSTLDAMHDYIRMLDCEGYPHAFLETEHLKIEFTGSSGVQDDEIIANVRITKK